MKIHKEIVWNKGKNPKKDGDYMVAMFWTDGSLYSIHYLGYTTKYGWNTSGESSTHGWGQNPNNGAYVWAELPF